MLNIQLNLFNSLFYSYISFIYQFLNVEFAILLVIVLSFVGLLTEFTNSLWNRIFTFVYFYFLLLTFLGLFIYLQVDEVITYAALNSNFNNSWNFFISGPIGAKFGSFSIPFLFLLNIINFITFIVYESAIYYKERKNQNLLKFSKESNKKIIINEKKGKFVALVLLLQVVLFLFFTVEDFIPFYITFEASMIPLFILIFIFGKRQERINAAYYLFFYTLVGSITFLIGLVYLMQIEGTTSFTVLIEGKQQLPLFLLFFLPFAVKLPMLPFHIWLPEAHVEASTEGSVLLAALLLKISGYGIIKVLMKLVPLGCVFFQPIVFTFALISLLYITASTLRQMDLKKIIAYSSIAHMNLALLGLFTNTIEGFYGSYVLMIIHGFVSSALFILIGYIYNRYHTRLVFYYSGLSINSPRWSSLFFLLTLANCSFPFTGAFLPEMLIFISLFKTSPLIGGLALIGSFLLVISSFLTYLRLCTGIPNKRNSGIIQLSEKLNILNLVQVRDITKNEYRIVFLLMVISSLGFFFPSLFFNIPVQKVVMLLYSFS